MPKTNNYRSLHTTVIGPGGERIEIQIRTRDMHLIAERGIAAHWRYKERGRINDESAEKFEWLHDLVNWNSQVRNSEEFLDTVKTDLFESEIYVFTPKGDVREFPEGSTPLDFAYAVHSDVGNRCVGARVNGKMVPLKYNLQNGDTVEIVTSNTQTPSKDWLKMCATNRAKSKIRAYVKEEQRKSSLLLGKDLLEREFRKFGASSAKYIKSEEMERLKKDFGIHDDEEVLVRIGYGKLEPRNVVERLAPELLTSSKQPVVEQKSDPNFIQKVFKSAAQRIKRSGSLVTVSGMDDVLVYYAKCCNPIPGDPIVGFITRGRGVTIHRSDCRKGFEFDQMRKVDVEWNKMVNEMDQMRSVRMQIISQDVPGMLKSLSEAFAVQGVNIESANIRTTRDKKAICTFEVAVKNLSQLNAVVVDLQKIKGVMEVSRLVNK
jgi:GTP pyrophosphokinase